MSAFVAESGARVPEQAGRRSSRHHRAAGDAGVHRLGAPEEFWDVVLGSGYRATVDDLMADQREALRRRVLGEVRADAVTTLRTDVVYGIAERD